MDRRTTCVPLLLCAGMLADAQATDISAYVGKYPFENVRGHTIYEVPEVKRNFVAKFGMRRWETVLGYTTTFPIEVVDDPTLGRVVVVAQCERHNCPNTAVVFLTLAADALGACFSDGTNTEWIGSGWNVRSRASDCGADAAGQVALFKRAAANRR